MQTKFKVSITEAGVKRRTSTDYYTGETLIFDSELEKKFFEEIIIKNINDGKILKYKLQQKYNLQPSFRYMGKTIRGIDYISDFDIWLSNGDFFVIDTKGMATADAKIKAKLFKYKYPNIKFLWMSYTKETGWITYEELQKHRRDKKKRLKK